MSYFARISVLGLERLLLIIALATLHLTSIGTGVVRAGKHRWVDHHWDRGLSYLQLGARGLRQQEQRGWQPFAPFRLDPAVNPNIILLKITQLSWWASCDSPG